MKATNSTMVFEKTRVISEDMLMSAAGNESFEKIEDHCEEPGYFFKGVIIGLAFCVPFWAVLFWLLT